ncbi:filamentous hemagglutinin outer membrane protein [Tolypothrix sp. NIES-4075]|uniref:two-partner secretion domain-containing protein n=1 Tax=Tolypothrix sp. NIES-4075 TaxID=2005459 RepID=UPI000B5C7BC5|nr:filamentous hemagglutinin N-terminal domain-containing protein [Tolypothrix sp. NIES-4075]GAX40409.1 filamentous hemagglutinin outer membrane protein [Tolypothrix sp. NIES-4075]
MAGNWRHGFFWLGLMVLGVQGAIASPDYAQAQQVVPDATLPINSAVSVNGNNFIINGGTQAGGNLFHSFSEFSVPTNGLAFFNNAQTIQNIISRVTGSSVSNIDGILAANGTANLFFLNPNGIVFGPNARLNLGGSFVASTASSLNFADGTKFSATTPENAPLLTVSVPLGLQFGTNAGSIQNQSGTLLVQPGNTLALVGGNVSLDRGLIGTLNGQVELGGLTAPGIVGLNADNLRLSFPEKVQRADVSLTNDARVAVFGGGGNIAVNARNLNISGASQIVAAIQQGLEALGSTAANIEINATDTVTLDGTSSTASPGGIANFVQGVGTAGNIFINTGSLNIIGNAVISSTTIGQGDGGSVTIRALDAVSLSGSSILSAVDSEGIGNGGDINIQARSLSLSDGARIGFVTNGQGDAGSVTIRALDAVSLSGRNSSIFSAVGASGVGNGGDINIQARSLSLSDDAQVATSTLGTGNAGNIQINTLDNISINNGSLIRADTFSNGNAGNIAIQSGGAVSFDGIGSFGVTSGVFTLVGTGLEFPGTGKGGDININARSLSLTNGAQLNASTFGQGDAGSIFVQARDSVAVVGVSPVNGDASRLTTAVNPGAIGNAGNLTIETGQLTVDKGAIVSTNTEANGNAGNLTINTGKLVVRDGGQISSNTAGKGDAGNLLVRASEFVQAENSPGVLTTTGLFAQVTPTGEGNAKDLTIETGRLTLINGAQVNATTFGKGNAGNLNIRASDINLIGISPQDMFPSALQVRVEPGATGNGGNLTIDTQRLSVTGGARVAADTTSMGNAGNLTVRAKDSVEVVGASPIIRFPSLLTTSVNPGAIGEAGNLTINTGKLVVRDGGQISSNTSGKGDAGNLLVRASEFVQAENSPGVLTTTGLFAQVTPTGEGNAKDLTIETGRLTLINGAQVNATTFGKGNAGNLNIRASDINLIGISPQDMFPSALQVRVEPGATGNGGNLTIDTQRLSVTGGARVAADTTSIGNAGNLTVRAKDSVEVAGASPIIKSPSRLTAAVNPGAIGKAGDLTIETGQLIVKNRAEVTVNSQGTGDAGELKITAGTIRLDNQGKLIAETASGNGGNILLRADDLLLLRRGSQISTTAGTDRAGGDGGNITINTPFLIAVPNENSDILANAFTGRGGRVDITATGVYGIESRAQPTLQSDITASSTLGVAGVVEINTPDVDPSRGLIALPALVVNSPELFASECNAFIGKEGSTFSITGRGGLPPSPDDFLSSDVVWSDTRLTAMTTQRHDLNTSTAKFVGHSPVAIVPATGWIFNNKGEVTLISNAANADRQDFGAATCAGNLSSSN